MKNGFSVQCGRLHNQMILGIGTDKKWHDYLRYEEDNPCNIIYTVWLAIRLFFFVKICGILIKKLTKYSLPPHFYTVYFPML